MKKTLAVLFAVLMMMTAVYAAVPVSAAQTDNTATGSISFDTESALYVHAVLGSDDSEAWQAWQCEHDEDFNEVNSSVKYFFLPTSANNSKADIYNGYADSVTVNGTSIAAGETKEVTYDLNTEYSVNADGTTYTLRFMKSSAEAAIYVNNTNADGNGTDLMNYLNVDKSNEAKASGAIVDANGTVDNTKVKKIKGRGNTTWDKPKKAYNITYSDAVSIGGMTAGKKYSILANYQDDSLSRNRFLYDLSDAVGMPYASDSRYVDFYVDGFYWGSYQMTQKIDEGKSSLVNDLGDVSYLNEDGSINADFPFFCEVDAGATDGEDYYVNTSSGNKVTIKYPELAEGDVGYSEVKNYVKTKFDTLFDKIKSKATDLADYADIDSLTKIYLINELGKNWDAGVSSLYFTYKQDADGNYKFYGSPVWDYDNSLGNANGSSGELSSIGVKDYTDYSGWWCKYKGRRSSSKSSSNIMNNIARNTTVLEAAPNIWFDEFVPAINTFANGTGDQTEIYSADDYYGLLKGSAEMNYQSGWLLDTGDWIALHTSLNTATFDMTTGEYTVSTTATKYDSNFDGAFDYCCDWLINRAAWLSSQMYADYTPELMLGDVNGDEQINVEDATLIQRYAGEQEAFTDAQLTAGDVNHDGQVNVEDATLIQRVAAEQETFA